MNKEDNISVIWRPLEGSQTLAMSAPAEHILYWGTRGSSKSDAQLMRFRSRVGCGYGSYWRGVIFDKEYKNLDDLIIKSKRWFSAFDDGARFHSGMSLMKWCWPTGEELLFRVCKDTNSYWQYHGQEFCIGADEEIITSKGFKKAIDVTTDDYLLTPLGYKKVVKLYPPTYRDCVSVDVYDACGNYVGRQLQGTTHRLLVNDRACDLQSPLTWSIFPQFCTQESDSVRAVQFPLNVDRENLFGVYRASFQCCSSSVLEQHLLSLCLFHNFAQGFQQLRPSREQLGYLLYEVLESLDAYGSKLLNVESFYEEFHCLRSDNLKLAQCLAHKLLMHQAHLHQLSVLQRQTSILYHDDPLFFVRSQEHNSNLVKFLLDQLHTYVSVLQALHRVNVNVLLPYENQFLRIVLNCLYYYLNDFYLHDVQLHNDKESVLNVALLQHDVLAHIHQQSQKGEQVSIDIHSHQNGYIFVHPYKDKLCCSTIPLHLGKAVSAPCGKLLTVDFEVEDANCYITSTGLVNRNSFIGWNELSKYPTLEVYDMMQSTNRSSYVPEIHGFIGGTLDPERGIPVDQDGNIPLPIPLETFSTTNPYGPSINAIKRRFLDVAPSGKIVKRTSKVFNPASKEEEEVTIRQVAIFGHWRENKYLSPKYIAELLNTNDPARLAAWAHGSLDALAGNAFGDLFDKQVHILPRFKIPKDWFINRAYDWGSSSPFSVGWYCESNGEEVAFFDGSVRCFPAGTIIRFFEWYGADEIGTNKGLKLSASDVAKGIIEREDQLIKSGIVTGIIHPGPADNQIRDKREIDVDTIEKKMQDEGVYWYESVKSAGSRVNGFELMRERLQASNRKEGEGFYVTEDCPAFISIFPNLTRDEKNNLDVDTNTEDHCLHGSTLVSTDKGKVEIKDLVGTEGLVHTVNGDFVKYSNCRLTRKDTKVIKLSLSDNSEIICTPDHKFLTIEGEWVQAKDMKNKFCYSINFTTAYGAKLCVLMLLVKLFKSLTVSAIICVENTLKTASCAQNPCIEMYGYSTREKFLKDIMYTIRKRIRHLIKLKIWNLKLIQNIYQITVKLKIIRTGLKLAKKAQKYSTVVKKVWRGIRNIMKSIVRKQCTESKNLFAKIVEKSTKLHEINIAPMRVSPLTGEKKVKIWRCALALSVGRLLKLVNMKRNRLVQDIVVEFTGAPSVLEIKNSGYANVYCMNVESTHAFSVENGVIVHNCWDECRYRILQGNNRLATDIEFKVVY